MKMFATVYRDTSLNFPYPDSIEYMGINSVDNIQGLKEALNDFRITMGLDDPVKIIIGKSEKIIRGFFVDEAYKDDPDDQYFAIDIEYVENQQIPMMNKLLPFDNEKFDMENFDSFEYLKSHIDTIKIDSTLDKKPTQHIEYALIKSVYRVYNYHLIHQAYIKKVSTDYSELEDLVNKDWERIKKDNPLSVEFDNESKDGDGVWVRRITTTTNELIVLYRIIRVIDDEVLDSIDISDPTEVMIAYDYSTKTPINIYRSPKTIINVNEIKHGVQNILGGDISDSDVKAIMDCFGFEINGQFIPLTAKPDGEEQTGMTPDEFQDRYKDIL